MSLVMCVHCISCTCTSQLLAHRSGELLPLSPHPAQRAQPAPAGVPAAAGPALDMRVRKVRFVCTMEKRQRRHGRARAYCEATRHAEALELSANIHSLYHK